MKRGWKDFEEPDGKSLGCLEQIRMLSRFTAREASEGGRNKVETTSPALTDLTRREQLASRNWVLKMLLARAWKEMKTVSWNSNWKLEEKQFFFLLLCGKQNS